MTRRKTFLAPKRVFRILLSAVLVFIFAAGGFPLPLKIQESKAAISPVVATVSGPSYSFTAEQVGGSDAHVLILTNPGGTPNYKWQFLTNGLRLFIDRKDAMGWIQLISEIRTAPEYLKRQGGPTTCVWNPYGLNLATTGADVLQNWDKQVQPDGSVKMVRTQEGSEEGITETLTSTWTVPESAEELGTEGPKASYLMSKNRGIVTDGSCEEGTWRMKWELSGISDIISDDLDIVDGQGWPIRKKSYSNNEFTVDVSAFDVFDTPQHTYSEIGTNNKAEVLFFKDGTVGDRVIDPTTVVSAIASGWSNQKQRVVFYNGENFFLVYTDGTDILYKASSDNATWSSASTLISGTSGDFDLYLVDDAKFDVMHINSGSSLLTASTCTISGQTVTCGSPSSDTTILNANRSVTRAPSSGRMFLAVADARIFIYSADQTGDASGITSWTEEENSVVSACCAITIVPYNDTDKALVIHMKDGGGANKGFFSRAVTRAGGGTTEVTIYKANSAALTSPTRFGNAIRVSDTDFRFIFFDENDNLLEYKWDDVAWSSVATISSSGSMKEPSLFYERTTGDMYAFAIDTSTTPDSVIRWKKPSGGSWDVSPTVVDDGEATARSLPATQMHEPPLGSSRSTPRELVWAYRVENGANFDLKVGNLQLAAGAAAFDQAAYRWFSNSDSSNVGSSLAPQDTATSLGASGAKFRLRLLLGVSTASLSVSGQDFTLQFADKGGGTCASPGGSYTNVTALTVIAFFDNPAVADNAALAVNGDDPTDGAAVIVNQSYQELNDFTNSEALIDVSQDGKWDFSLHDNGAPDSTTYCFRAVKTGGTLLDTYTKYPEITTGVAVAAGGGGTGNGSGGGTPTSGGTEGGGDGGTEDGSGGGTPTGGGGEGGGDEGASP